MASPLFPIFNLPQVALEQLFRTFVAHDLIAISQTSQRCKRLAQKTAEKYQIEEFQFDLQDDSIFIRLIFPGEDNTTMFGYSNQLESEVVMNFEEIEFAVEPEAPILLRYFRSPQIISSLIKVTGFIMSIFSESRIIEKHLSINWERIPDFRMLFEWEFIKTLDQFNFQTESIEPELMDLVFRNIRVKKELIVDIMTDEEYSVREVYSPQLAIQCTPPVAVTSEFLLNSLDVSTNIFIRNGNIRNDDINEFLKKWYRGERSSLEFLQVMIRDNPRAFNLQVVLADIDWTFWIPTKRDRDFKIKGRVDLPMGDAYDIEREDGLLASVLLYRNCFIFAVWHIRRPSTPL